ncbi:DUF3990 domain-containing protein [Adlercreutzia sp. ZJ138]|uniref:DUF3990 domain-containing protein n=1 Tax=Adlercreutzia sp. ZJ138 TaxID=2709405 RepID=UPI0013EA211F|nr:DUF3990 domain-containing protein [Adlercreutzia sp. ZJ138]
MILYHGSRHGLEGSIAPISRDRCDFGKGFYLGTNPQQPLTLICNYPEARLYTVELDLDNLDVREFEADSLWALVVAYYRGKMEQARGTEIYEKAASALAGADAAIGPIANDRMFVVLDRFFNGEITDVALVQCLSALQLGNQVVALTQAACDAIHIIDERTIDETERTELIAASEANRAEGVALAERICRAHRRDGLFFDEILNGGVPLG